MEKKEHSQEKETPRSFFEETIGGACFDAVFAGKKDEPWYPKLKTIVNKIYPKVVRDASYFLPMVDIMLQEGSVKDVDDLVANMKEKIPAVFQLIYDYFFPMKNYPELQKEFEMTEDDENMIKFLLRQHLPTALRESIPSDVAKLTHKATQKNKNGKYPKYSEEDLRLLTQQVREQLDGTL
jgi:hypothetical protein